MAASAISHPTKSITPPVVRSTVPETARPPAIVAHARTRWRLARSKAFVGAAEAADDAELGIEPDRASSLVAMSSFYQTSW